MIQTLLVDDEPMALSNLKYILKSFPAFNVAGACAVPEDALEFCANHEVDVVFMDIEMPRIKGMELMAKMREIRPALVVVFVTAYRDYAIRAFETNAQDYLLKPITMERMAITARKVEQQLQLLRSAAKHSSERGNANDYIFGKNAGSTYLLSPEEILYFTTESKNVVAVTPNGVYILQHSLSYLESRLPKQLFFRCHTAYIVNLKKIEYIAPRFRNAYSIKIVGITKTVPVSRTFAKNLKQRVSTMDIMMSLDRDDPI
ncbi:Transcriptional regulatory protein YpdB [bioreactor metagenome]|uniref:Transcriptional regulatory protein YpdB n=1 Tax=bioreactor metagenome TaxID=1076179 RepID=A0A644TFI1_9ZZZZ|nr:LytTR family DNA-binding domain-containing protein [Negativicutes bacterium]